MLATLDDSCAPARHGKASGASSINAEVRYTTDEVLGLANFPDTGREHIKRRHSRQRAVQQLVAGFVTHSNEHVLLSFLQAQCVPPAIVDGVGDELTVGGIMDGDHQPPLAEANVEQLLSEDVFAGYDVHCWNGSAQRKRDDVRKWSRRRSDHDVGALVNEEAVLGERHHRVL